MLQILGAGLPRTGTATLCEALRLLGYAAIHHAPARSPLWPTMANGWATFSDVDAVADAPAAMYWRELRRAYDCKVILTVRDVADWWHSIKRHANKIRTGADIEHIRYTEALHGILFGVPQPQEYWYKRRFREHIGMVTATVPADQLLILDITGGDKWETLCPFLGMKEPEEDWPWLNRLATSDTQ